MVREKPSNSCFTWFISDTKSGTGSRGPSADPRIVGPTPPLTFRAATPDYLAYFGLFAVDPTRHAGGIGRSILARAKAHARGTWGVRRLEMWVIWTREELISWYVRRGYTRTERTMPFPYAHLVNGRALRDDLHFAVLDKVLCAAPLEANDGL
ncbi:Uncharacterized protein TPAR_07583 [Tolypocladium paradoxum]|uniref:N-acetyltransferase domain-containing protein n=1 Tax=Tolypocladium paradoxum TaxID=94208 RepID=A0A2S4KPV7_9HYPO|nr:Uncharacterized protein TPAR_07583 [Tolypocladium paradoxum]